jgi:hypothetical protein
MMRLYFNGVKQNGICLDECEELIELLNPSALVKLKKFVGSPLRMHIKLSEVS